jgi:hypothetical protein
MKNGFMGLALLWAFSGTSLAAPVDGEWTGTLSCGELQNSPNAKSKAPFTGAVTLTIHKNSASLDRVWPKGKEHLEGTVSRGQPIKLEGQGWFYGKEANAWNVRVKLFETGQRYEGKGVLESADGLTRYRDCKVRVESAISPPQIPTTTKEKLATEAPKKASKSEPTNLVKSDDAKSASQSNAEAPTAQPISPTESVADTRNSNSSPPNVPASEPTQATPPSQPVEVIVPTAVSASAPVAVAEVASASSPGPMQSNATNDEPFALSAIAAALIGALVATLGFIGYQRFNKYQSTKSKSVQTGDDLPNSNINSKSEYIEVLDIDLPDSGASVEKLKSVTDLKRISPSKENYLRIAKYGGALLLGFGILVTTFSYVNSRPSATDNVAQTNSMNQQSQVDRSAIQDVNDNSQIDQTVADIKAHPSDRDFIASGPGYEIIPGTNIYYSTDRFHEDASCQFEFDGKGPSASKGVRKWRLIYFKDKNRELITSGMFFENTPIRVYLEGDSNYLETDKNGQLLLTSNIVRRMMSTKTIKLQHGFSGSDEVSWTYDMTQFSLLRNAALKLCP